jgi:hypothetical protein
MNGPTTSSLTADVTQEHVISLKQTMRWVMNAPHCRRHTRTRDQPQANDAMGDERASLHTCTPTLEPPVCAVSAGQAYRWVTADNHACVQQAHVLEISKAHACCSCSFIAVLRASERTCHMHMCANGFQLLLPQQSFQSQVITRQLVDICSVCCGWWCSPCGARACVSHAGGGTRCANGRCDA